jgi:hypothetical protein
MLQANQPLITLGKLKKNTPHNFKFVLNNTSDKPITIENISVGCGSCTQASCSNILVEPSRTTDVNVIFTPNSGGQQLKRVTVTYTGGKVDLKFSAEII